MNKLDEVLRREFARREPPPGFADRVMKRIPKTRSRTWGIRSWMPAAAAVLIAVLGVGTWEHDRIGRNRARAEKAKSELMWALELTSGKLNATRTRIMRQKGGVL
ncbi:MAG: hypothetical protein H7Y20_01070 [Bryobacteraceae bacterium]|nr:hypothetical protein [Bryobacteraceae bacterium]